MILGWICWWQNEQLLLHLLLLIVTMRFLYFIYCTLFAMIVLSNSCAWCYSSMLLLFFFTLPLPEYVNADRIKAFLEKLVLSLSPFPIFALLQVLRLWLPSVCLSACWKMNSRLLSCICPVKGKVYATVLNSSFSSCTQKLGSFVTMHSRKTMPLLRESTHLDFSWFIMPSVNFTLLDLW